MRSPFSLYKKQTQQGHTWYARFWNEKVRRYIEYRSTGVTVSGKKWRWQEAWHQAMEILANIGFEDPKPGVADIPFLEYVAGFWKEGSDYIRDCANIGKEPLSLKYIRGNANDTRLHISPYEPFQGLALGKLTAGHIRAWMRWADENGRTAHHINSALGCVNTT